MEWHLSLFFDLLLFFATFVLTLPKKNTLVHERNDDIRLPDNFVYLRQQSLSQQLFHFSSHHQIYQTVVSIFYISLPESAQPQVSHRTVVQNLRTNFRIKKFEKNPLEIFHLVHTWVGGSECWMDSCKCDIKIRSRAWNQLSCKAWWYTWDRIARVRSPSVSSLWAINLQSLSIICKRVISFSLISPWKNRTVTDKRHLRAKIQLMKSKYLFLFQHHWIKFVIQMLNFSNINTTQFRWSSSFF